MGWESWFIGIIGVVCVGIGLAYLLSPRFSEWAMAKTSQGRMWSKMVGEANAPTFAKYVFSLVSFAAGAYFIYCAYRGQRPW
jgi:hypothetical protein